MKKILVVCGNGIASSSIMVSVLQDFLKEEKIEAQVDKSSLPACTSDTFNSMTSGWFHQPNSITRPLLLGQNNRWRWITDWSGRR